MILLEDTITTESDFGPTKAPMNTKQTSRIAILAFLAALWLPAPALRAQTAAQVVATDADVSRQQMMRPVTRQLFQPDEQYAPPSPADSDLGEQRLLVPNERYKSLTLFANAAEFYTTNAELTNGGTRGDWFTNLQFGATWLPRLKGSLYGEMTVLQQLYRYADLSDLSFNSLDVGGGFIYVFRGLEDLSFFARYNWNLLTNASSDSTIFSQQTIRLGLQKPFNFSRAHSLTVGVGADLNLAGWPDYALRHRFPLMASYQLNLTRRVQMNLFYMVAYFPFVETSRQDWNQVLSAAVAYNFSPRFSVSASVSASFNNSNDSFYTYNVLNTGAGLSANYKF